MSDYTAVVLDDLPTISRQREGGGVWVDRTEALRQNPGKWVVIHGPVENAHPTVANLNSGKAAGIDPEDYEFKGRTIDPDTAAKLGLPTTDQTDKDGNVLASYVIGRLLTDEQKAEREKARREAAKESGKAKAKAEA